MQRRLRIINSTEIEPDGKTNYIIAVGADNLDIDGCHSVQNYVDDVIEMGRETLVFRR